ncbi:MAG: HD domain-containing protein [Chloroflexi bacterium]|nr:HD domain-containing protein [Chloroflexota bacterium]
MTKPDFVGAKQYILDRLAHELAPDLYYHGIQHTSRDVLAAVRKLGEMMSVNGEELLLLETAALFHDAGYLVQYYANEEIGVSIAAGALPRYGYSPAQIEAVGEIIMATRLPQEPANLLQEIICDADLDSLGREDFFIVSQCLRLEQLVYGQPSTLREWYERQLNFLREHSYFTAAARSFREPGKQKNIEEIEALLNGRTLL